MRALAIGVGGAGCRIVDRIHDHDRRSRVSCLYAVAVDTDPNTLLHLTSIPDSDRIYFPVIDPEDPENVSLSIDIEEIMTRLQRVETHRIDAIMVFTGLGGRMAGIVPRIVNEIRRSFVEPVFLIATLPCINEGKRQTARAVEQLDDLKSISDAVLLFDNETWYRRLRAMFNARRWESMEIQKQIEYRLHSTGDNPRDIFDALNERIARRIGLLLRAGEFSEDGIEVGEVVLDAGEVLKTLEEGGYASIGYAVERLPRDWRSMLLPWRQSGYFIESSQQRAARIVSLAKKAVYEEVSVPCDLTSAEKALVLIAGPTEELSIKGFQSVRRWIDRSIAGLEMRSGDYPVKNTRYVGIIVMLAGLSNIPRLEEMREIREIYIRECEEVQREDDAPQDIQEEVGVAPPVVHHHAREPEDEAGLDDLLEEFSEDEEDLNDIDWLAPPEELFDDLPIPDDEKDEDTGVPGQVSEEWDGTPTVPPAGTPDRVADIDLPHGKIEVPVASEGSAISGGGALSNIPPRAERHVAEITRSTNVGGIKAPDDSVFGNNVIKSSTIPQPREIDASGNLRIGGLKRPKDDLFAGRRIQAGVKGSVREIEAERGPRLSPVMRPKDDAYAGVGMGRMRDRQTVRDGPGGTDPVPVRPRGTPPADDILRSRMAERVPDHVRRSEAVTGLRRLMLRDAGRSSSRPDTGGRKGDDRVENDAGIDWL